MTHHRSRPRPAVSKPPYIDGPAVAEPTAIRLVTLVLLATGLVATVACTGTSDSSPGGSGVGAGSISGSIDGRAFNGVGASYVIGKPDDPAQTTVIYLFDSPVTCGELNHTAWDESVADSTQSLEIKLIGQSVGDYPVAADGRPSAGESDVNYTVTSTSGTPSEVSATAGTVTVSQLSPSTSADGSFNLTFAGGSLAGDFAAVECADAVEP